MKSTCEVLTYAPWPNFHSKSNSSPLHPTEGRQEVPEATGNQHHPMRRAGRSKNFQLYRVADTTEQLHFHFSLLCVGEGNGNPLQCSCLENPRHGKPGGLLSMGSHRVGHDWSDAAAAAAGWGRRKGGDCLVVQGFLLGWLKVLRTMTQVVVIHTVNDLNATELFTAMWLRLCYAQ